MKLWLNTRSGIVWIVLRCGTKIVQYSHSYITELIRRCALHVPALLITVTAVWLRQELKPFHRLFLRPDVAQNDMSSAYGVSAALAWNDDRWSSNERSHFYTSPYSLSFDDIVLLIETLFNDLSVKKRCLVTKKRQDSTHQTSLMTSCLLDKMPWLFYMRFDIDN